MATTTTAVPTTTIGATTTTLAADAAPPELSGTWRTVVVKTDENASLSLNRNQYVINRGQASGFGVISVDGDLITFSGSDLCPGEGLYQWAIVNDELTFTPIEPQDPCGGRRDVLIGLIYTR